ncbi:MAG: stage V sporulation protein SpoVM [Oscillospiraceae bacterium]|nr:stage V sporulation protein SpoVM [Oscillospiraceae bacterium]
MKIVVVKSPKVLSGFLRFFFGMGMNARNGNFKYKSRA